MSETPSRLSPACRAQLAVIWLALMLEAFWLSPVARPDQSEWLMRLIGGDWAGEEMLVVALFNLMGIWPLAMAGLLADRLRGWPPLWPFAAASMALGGFVLLPGVLVAGDRGLVSTWQRVLVHPVLRAGLAFLALGLVVWGVMLGDLGGFVQIWRTEQFVHVMAFDFVALWLSSVVLARENGAHWQLALVPLLGALAVAGFPESEGGSRGTSAP